MLDVVLIMLVLAGWAGVMVWAYWGNGGAEAFKKSLRETLDKIKKMW